MVFCGKPSGGCHACRARKTRCDKVPEGCTQCKKAKRTCPGYRNPGDLIFRDESTNVVHKIKAREARESRRTKTKGSPASDITIPQDDDTESISLSTSLEIVQQDNSPLSAEYALAPTLEDRAVGCFVFNYVMNRNGPSRGHMQNLAEMSRVNVLGDSLTTAIKAVGLAAYAHAARAPSLSQNASFQYMKAIQLTNAALRSPEDVTKDSTLMAIHILSIYETITGCKQRSFKDWTAHLNGAAAVVKLRGIDQIKDREGRHMLLQLSSQMMIVCMQSNSRLPAHIREYMKAAFAYVEETAGTPEATFVVQECMASLSDLRADIAEGIITDPQVIISKCVELDGTLLKIVTEVPPGWEYTTVYTDRDSDFIFNGRYHVYHDHWMAQIWNSLRTLRAMLNEKIRDLLLEGFSSKPTRFTEPEYAAQFQICTETLIQMHADILASTVQHLGTGMINNTNANPQDLALIPMSGGAFLMWPLWFAGVMDVANPTSRGFVVKNLHAIADILGIQQARVLARSVETQTGLKALTRR
ncbi:hypothetical protein LSUE1_G002769 [Lachnellula suecica]|uniref:Zn(2)-C6 fungal-type domain-containing protein n=1 Tax=Lachnellula suecica TaxID=602035 RepID=A0A8T9C733_9HELO|nr:hypothetical protein LSUE1_G002769 [Lachnellula suecica]